MNNSRGSGGRKPTSGVVLNSVLEREFRSNPAYELVPFYRLPLDQQALLSDLTEDPGFYGVLKPRAAGARAVKSVCQDTASLVHTLLQPGPLPHYMKQDPDGQSNRAVAEMVLDGVLEIEHEGRFVSGAEAYPLIYAHAAPEADGLLPRLSQAALEYAQQLLIDDVGRLSARLYFYNRIPLTPSWTRRLPDEAGVAGFLGLHDPTNQRLIQGSWSQVGASASNNAWLQWQSRRHRFEQDDTQAYKLYVSPQPDALPEAFRAVLEVLEQVPAHHFKVGSNSIGLLRPDKLVLYFEDFDPLQQAAYELAGRLSGCAAHGVPFTAAITDDGLLSWGIDPRWEKGTLRWQGPGSWRLSVTNRLATALVLARNACPEDLEPWQFAVERLRLENVDTATWTPIHDHARPS